MSRQLAFSEQANRDLDDIWSYLVEFDEGAADSQITRIVEKCTYLIDMPFMGLKRNDLLPDLRRIIEGNYTIFYLVNDNEIQIVRVLRSNRDFKRHL